MTSARSTDNRCRVVYHSGNHRFLGWLETTSPDALPAVRHGRLNEFRTIQVGDAVVHPRFENSWVVTGIDFTSEGRRILVRNRKRQEGQPGWHATMLVLTAEEMGELKPSEAQVQRAIARGLSEAEVRRMNNAELAEALRNADIAAFNEEVSKRGLVVGSTVFVQADTGIRGPYTIARIDAREGIFLTPHCPGRYNPWMLVLAPPS